VAQPFIVGAEQQYSNIPWMAFFQPVIGTFIPPVASINPPTRSAWTTDSALVTADSINFTCDGADLINDGGVDIPERRHDRKLSYSVSVPLYVQLKGFTNDG
jgi:hypothetical protein